MPNKQSFQGRSRAPFSCLPKLLEHQAQRIPDLPAILAIGQSPLNYRRLYEHIDKMGRALRALGIRRHDRIVVVLPNGPELAVAILTVEASAVCAPLNPAYGAEELERYFSDLRPCALITQAGINSPARRVACSRGVRVLELSTAPDTEAGLFTLTGDPVAPPADDSLSPGDVALLLPTSGTTSHPKIVPLTHANICTSAFAHRAALALNETDRCLNVLPLFHGHGLNATVLASLAAGASVVCTPGLSVDDFSAWLTTFQPTWYSALPAMHQAILGRTRHDRGEIARGRLRFIRSSSAPLPPRIFRELEQTFEAPLIEWYGMTEVASSPIACNPLPPRQRKAGSVGVSGVLDVVIMSEAETLLRNGETGQVVVRGASVMRCYDSNPMVTQAAFAGDWFKTGDLGFFDDGGYLFLVGRTREMINRGGEKIAPQEVDEVLLDHPGVAEAVTFSVPHPTLGEDVASAVVLRPHQVATPKDIRQFAIGRIADFKVPRQVHIVSEIPKGPTGKVQRVGLAAKLGLATSTAPPHALVGPRTPLETALVERWAEILQLEHIGIHSSFFELGGDSLSATDVLRHVYALTQVKLEVSQFFAGPTVAEVAYHVEKLLHAGPVPERLAALVPITRENDIAPASIAQERLWTLQQALPDLPFFNILYPLRLTSPLNTPVLEQSINDVVRRHEILRTTFAVIDGRCAQIIAPSLIVPLPFHDLRRTTRSKKEKLGHQLVQEEALRSFDITKGPLIRARLIRLAEQDHLLLISMHQIICDGWSLGVFVEELVASYDDFSAQEEAILAPDPIQYADFAHWQRQWRSHSQTIAQLDYWRQHLREPLSAMQLARSAPARIADDLRTARRDVALPASLTEAAKRFSHQEGGTLFMVLVATMKTLLYCYLGEEDIRVATNVANRNQPGTEALIGPLANTVILRTDLGGDPSFREVMRRVRETSLAAFAHQELPFQALVETLERDSSRTHLALASVMILLQNAALRPTMGSGRHLDFEEANPDMLAPLVTATSFEVILMLRDVSQGLVGTCVYKPHLFRAKAIDLLLQDFREVLKLSLTQPDRPISTIRISLNKSRLN
jgi:acyl-CoA synthetase (AMP-forming)/AMP-acid ligase II